MQSQARPQTKVFSQLHRAADAELAHAGLQGGAFHAQNGGSAAGSGDAPLGLLESAENVLTFGLFESGDWGGGGSWGSKG